MKTLDRQKLDVVNQALRHPALRDCPNMAGRPVAAVAADGGIGIRPHLSRLGQSGGGSI